MVEKTEHVLWEQHHVICSDISLYFRLILFPSRFPCVSIFILEYFYKYITITIYIITYINVLLIAYLSFDALYTSFIKKNLNF